MSKKHLMIMFISVLIVAGVASLSYGKTSIPEKKQTTLGLYINAKDAYAKWLSDPQNIKIIDCRTPEEYIFVGHAPMAHNIPSRFITHKMDPESKKFVMKDNPDFVSLVRKKFKPSDTIMIICRSGGRSASGVNKLAQAGFKKVYTITDGFEGDTVKNPENLFRGKRLKNGWKNAGNPWTYTLDAQLAYTAE